MCVHLPSGARWIQTGLRPCTRWLRQISSATEGFGWTAQILVIPNEQGLFENQAEDLFYNVDVYRLQPTQWFALRKWSPQFGETTDVACWDCVSFF